MTRHRYSAKMVSLTEAHVGLKSNGCADFKYTSVALGLPIDMKWSQLLFIISIFQFKISGLKYSTGRIKISGSTDGDPDRKLHFSQTAQYTLHATNIF